MSRSVIRHKNPRGKLTHPSQGQELESAGRFTDQTKNIISSKKCEKVLYVTVIYTTVPTVADLGPHSPDSISSSLVPYGMEEDSSPEEDQVQQDQAPEQMEKIHPWRRPHLSSEWAYMWDQLSINLPPLSM